MNSIEDVIKKLEGVIDVEISKEDNKVSVSGTVVDRETIVTKLSNLGDPKKRNNSAFAEVKSFVSCAKGNLSAN